MHKPRVNYEEHLMTLTNTQPAETPLLLPTMNAYVDSDPQRPSTPAAVVANSGDTVPLPLPTMDAYAN